MFENITIFEVVRVVFFWVSPILFALGLLLVFYSKFEKIEAALDREIGPTADKKIRIHKLEDNIYTFDKWLLQNKRFLGIVCILISVAFYTILRS